MQSYNEQHHWSDLILIREFHNTLYSFNHKVNPTIKSNNHIKTTNQQVIMERNTKREPNG